MNNELYHYGVKGQKWGVRRSKNSFTGSSPKARVFGRVMDERPPRRRKFPGTIDEEPNAKRKTKRISEMKLGKLDNYKAVQHGKVLVEKLLDPETSRKY